MNLEWFHSFLATARLKSLSKASEQLNLSQPALSKQVQKLEEALGVVLFTRSPAGMELTEAGTVLLTRIQPVLDELEAIRKDLQNLHDPMTIAIGALPSLAAYYLPPRILGLRQQGMEIDIRVANTSFEVFRLLEQEAVDVAVIETKSLTRSLWSAELFFEPYYAVFPADHPLRSRWTVTLSDIASEPLVLYPLGCDVRQSVVQAFHERRMEPRIASEVAFGEFILGFVAAGAGITIVPKLIAEHIGHLPLSAAPISDFPAVRTVSLVARSRQTGKKLYDALIRSQTEHAKKPSRTQRGVRQG